MQLLLMLSNDVEESPGLNILWIALKQLMPALVKANDVFGSNAVKQCVFMSLGANVK